MRVLAAVLGLVAALASCPCASAAQFSFAAFGDVPYNAVEEPQLVSMIAEMNHETLAFSIHVGDFKDPREECADALFLKRRETFQLSHHAFFYTPGDNEWVDCRRARAAPHPPMERLAKLRELFFASDSSLGQRAIQVQSQRGRGYPENQRWTVQGVVFASVNVPGPDNHRAAMPAEYQARNAAVLDWLLDAFKRAREQKSPAVVIATQANLFTGNAGFADIVAAITREARSFDGQVLVVHGDTHWFTFEKPFADVPNVTRLEVHGSPFVNWSYVTVTIEDGKARFAVRPGADVAAGRAR